MKLTNILLATYLGLIGCNGLLTPIHHKPRVIVNAYDKLKNAIGYENIFLTLFRDINNNIPSKKINLPSDLENLISSKKFEPKNKEKFENLVYKEANKFGFTRKKIKNLSSKQTIQLVADIVKQRLKFSMKYNKDHSKTIDELFEEGIAECTMYTEISAAVFNIFKKINPNLTNVYMINSILERVASNNHDNNVIFIYDGKKLQISYIDITWYDTDKKVTTIEATDKSHVDIAWRGVLFKKLEDYKSALKEFQKLIKEYRYDKELQVDLLYLIRNCASMLDDEELEKKAETTLLTKYPNSGWAKAIKEVK